MALKLETKSTLLSVVFILSFDIAYSLLRWPDFSRSNYTAIDASWLHLYTYWINSIVTYTLLAIYVLKSRLGAYVVMPYFVIVQTFFYYLSGHYGLFTTSTILTAIFQTNIQEASSHIYPIHYIAIPFFIFILFGGICYTRNRCRLPYITQRMACCLFWGYLTLTTGGLYTLVRYFPSVAAYLAVSNDAGAVPQTKEALRASAMQHMTNEDESNYIYRAFLPFYRPFSCLGTMWIEYFFPNTPPPSESFPSYTTFKDDKTAIVLFIGESFRADHSPWNGYKRNTLPNLSKCRNYINFPYASSYATVTITSIYGMISNASTVHREASATSFMGILKKHDFSTGLLTSRSGGWYKVPSIRTLIQGNVDSITELPANTTNEEIEIQFHTLCSRLGDKCFILMEDGSGHMPYHHEKQFTKFTETGITQNDINIQKYDNCLLQTDDLLCRIISQLKDKNAILIYSSDHGQSFGEDGYYTHGGLLSLKEQRHVFTFVWYSDEYRNKHPEIIGAMSQNRLKPISHNHLFHTIISLCGIRSALQIKEMDLTKPNSLPNAKQYEVDGDL